MTEKAKLALSVTNTADGKKVVDNYLRGKYSKHDVWEKFFEYADDGIDDVATDIAVFAMEWFR